MTPGNVTFFAALIFFIMGSGLWTFSLIKQRVYWEKSRKTILEKPETPTWRKSTAVI